MKDDAPAEERGVGDEIAGDERSGRGAASGPWRKWNLHKRIVIHCMGLDRGDGREILEVLAEENGGRYAHQ